MKRTARIAAVAILPGLVIVASICFVLFGDGKPGSEARGTGTTPNPDPLGGEEIALEVFDPEGRRLWLLSLENVVVKDEGLLVGTDIEARYFGTEPATVLTAGEIVHQMDQGSLVFRGRPHLAGPSLQLSGGELRWDDRSRSFSASGGYSLTRDHTLLQGERLWIDGDLQAMRAMGETRLRTLIPGREGSE